MAIFKPFLRITLLSAILAGLLIYLGIKYHWGDHLKTSGPSELELVIPKEIEKLALPAAETIDKPDFDLDIEKGNVSASPLLSSMNKEQMAGKCTKLLSKSISDELTLEIATANCVVSNYEETFQDNTLNEAQLKNIKKQKDRLRVSCKQQYPQQSNYDVIEIQLLIGMCVSDKFNHR